MVDSGEIGTLLSRTSLRGRAAERPGLGVLHTRSTPTFANSINDLRLEFSSLYRMNPHAPAVPQGETVSRRQPKNFFSRKTIQSGTTHTHEVFLSRCGQSGRRVSTYPIHNTERAWIFSAFQYTTLRKFQGIDDFVSVREGYMAVRQSAHPAQCEKGHQLFRSGRASTCSPVRIIKRICIAFPTCNQKCHQT